MKRIKAIYFERLRAEAHLQLLRVFRAMVEAGVATRDLLREQLPKLDLLLEKERQLVDAPRKKPETTELKAADKALDDLLSFAQGIIRSNLKNPDAATAAAAAELLAMIDSSFKHLQRKDYESEIVAVNLLLDQLQGPYRQQASLVGIAQHLDQLRANAATLESLIAQRTAEEAARLHETMGEIRKEIELQYHQMVERVEVAAATDPNGQYDTFIAEWNQKVHDENEKHHHAHVDLGKGSACVVAVQGGPFAATGHPITPTVGVTLHQEGKPAVALYMGSDYALTYKNNVKAGLATVTVHGKGRYKGMKSATFEIAQAIG